MWVKLGTRRFLWEGSTSWHTCCVNRIMCEREYTLNWIDREYVAQRMYWYVLHWRRLHTVYDNIYRITSVGLAHTRPSYTDVNMYIPPIYSRCDTNMTYLISKLLFMFDSKSPHIYKRQKVLLCRDRVLVAGPPDSVGVSRTTDLISHCYGVSSWTPANVDILSLGVHCVSWLPSCAGDRQGVVRW